MAGLDRRYVVHGVVLSKGILLPFPPPPLLDTLYLSYDDRGILNLGVEVTQMLGFYSLGYNLKLGAGTIQLDFQPDN